MSVGSSPTLLFFLMTRYRVYLRSKLNKFLPNVLAEPARFYFWRFLRRLELVSCPINSTARRVAMKMGRQACPAAAGSVTSPFRYAPSSRPAAAWQLPDRRPILIATKAMLFMGQDTNPGVTPTIPVKKAEAREFQDCCAEIGLCWAPSSRMIDRSSPTIRE